MNLEDCEAGDEILWGTKPDEGGRYTVLSVYQSASSPLDRVVLHSYCHNTRKELTTTHHKDAQVQLIERIQPSDEVVSAARLALKALL